MFNKLYMATTSCPAAPPRWRSGVEVDVESILGREEELLEQFVQIQKKEYPDQSGASCECSD